MQMIAQFTFVGGGQGKDITLIRRGAQLLVGDGRVVLPLHEFVRCTYGGQSLRRIVRELGPKGLTQLDGALVEWGWFSDTRAHKFVRIVGGLPDGRKYYRRFY